MNKNMIALLTLLWTHNAHAVGWVQNEDVKSLSDIKSAALSTTGNLTISNACITSLGSTSGLLTGMYIYDATTPARISAGTTIAGLPGSCAAGQVQMSSTAVSSATGDTITFGGQASQEINVSKIWDDANSQQLSSTLAGLLSSSLTNDFFYLGNGSNIAVAVQMSGDTSMANTGSVTVKKIQGNSVSTSTPSNGQVLKYNSTTTQWQPDTDAGATYTAGTALSLNSTTFYLANTAVSPGTYGSASTIPSVVVDAQGRITSASNAGLTVTLAGDVSGAFSANTVDKIKNVSVSTAAPSNGQVLRYNSSTTAWEPNSLTLAGDVTGVYSANSVVKIQAVSVSTTAPSNGFVLKYNSTTTQWAPATESSASPTVSSITFASSPFTVPASNTAIFVDATNGAISIQLPAPSAGYMFYVKDTKGLFYLNNVTLVRAAAEKIEGLAQSYVMQGSYKAWQIISDGTDWYLF